MVTKTFDDYISERGDEIAKWIAKKYGDEINDLENFEEIFRKSEIADNFNSGNTPITNTGIVSLWLNPAIKESVKNNVSLEDYDEMYGEKKIRGLGFRKPIKKEKVISYEKVKNLSHTAKGKTYYRNVRKGKAYFWLPKEENYLKILKAKAKTKKMKSSDIINAYNQRFKESTRSEKSLKSKIYRL